MNLGDGLLFELENGKPRLILLSQGAEKNPSKPSGRPRTANILSSRQPSCVDESQGEERPARQLAVRHKTGGAAASFTSFTSSTGGKSTAGCNLKVTPKVKSDRQKQSAAVGSQRTKGKTGQPQSSGGKKGQKDTSVRGDTGLKDGLVCLTNEQLQKILNTVQTSSAGRLPPEESRTQENKTDSKCDSSTNERGEIKEEDGGGGGGTPGCSQDKNIRLSGCLFSWMDQRQTESRAAVDAKKAQWRRELDEQVALKQQKQRSAPSTLQAEEDTDSLLSVQSSVSHREQPAAIRSSLRLGEVTPVEEVLGLERREDQRRRWLQELDRQREETTERRRTEKLLQSQMEDHELWATHFDSLQKKPPVLHTAAPPPALPNGSERGEWEPSSSLSLVWEAMSSCGAESVGGASVDTTSGYPTRASHLRTMTALLDPVQIEERERRRLKQLEQQRDIEAQLEERRRLKEQEEARRREEEEREERRLALERDRLERRYELDAQRERQKLTAEQSKKNPDEETQEETQEEQRVPRRGSEEVNSSVSPYKDTAVQTDEALSLARTVDTQSSAHSQPPPSLAAAPPNSRSRAGTAGKENICVQAGGGGGGGGGGGDPYEAFTRTERSRRDKRRPEWNTQRPSRRFVPASERYPAPLQRHRHESRLKRQAELLALQEKACVSRSDPPPLSQDPRLLPNPSQTEADPNSKAQTFTRGSGSSAALDSDRGRSPPVPAVRHRVQGQQAPPPSSTPPLLEYIPYVRTDEVFNLDPLEPADTPPPHTHTEAPPQTSTSPPAPPRRDALLHPELRLSTQTQRQQEILRGLAQLRQGLLQKQRELEVDLNPLLKRHDNDLRTSSASHRM